VTRVGATLPGGFRLLSHVASDARGEVYRAEHKALSRSVAIRILPRLSPDIASRVEAEARDASRLSHPNVAAILHVGLTDERDLFVVSELPRGEALDAGPWPPRRAIAVLRQVLSALGEAHGLGLVHGSLDRRSIVIEPLRPRGESARVADFGLASVDDRPVDASDDVRAAASILWELVTGRTLASLEDESLDPRVVAPEARIPDRVADLLVRTISGDLEPSAGALADVLGGTVDPITEVRGALPTMGPSSGSAIACAACHAVVPALAFCGKCGSRLPIRTLVPQAHALVFPLPLVGRDEDVAWLEDRLADASRGVVGARVVGEAGSGRTRLLAELAAHAKACGHVVIAIGRAPYGVPVLYDAVRRAIVALAEIDTASMVGAFPGAKPDTRRALVEIVLGLRGDTDTRPPEARRFAAAEALRWAFARAAELGGSAATVLVVDDLDELDGPSRTAFTDVVGDAPRVPALIVASHAPGFDAGWPAEHPARPIGGLPAEIASILIPTGRADARVRAATDAGGRGVLPLYVEHLARLATEGGSSAPARLGDLLALRLDHLPGEARRTLEALSVLGLSAHRGTLSAMRPDGDVDPALDHLIETGFVTTQGSLASVAHPIVRDLVLGTMPAEQRRELHARALTLLDGREVPVEVRAFHAFHAAAMPLAVRLANEVATNARAVGDMASVIGALTHAHDLSGRDVRTRPTEATRTAFHAAALRLADALTEAGAFTDAERTVDDVLALDGWDPRERIALIERGARLAAARGNADLADALLDLAMDLAVEVSSEGDAARLEAQRRAWTGGA
jgi:serine/threonine-protein kinase